MQLLNLLIHWLFYCLGIYLAGNCLYLLFFAVAGHRKTKPLPDLPHAPQLNRMCLLLPAYQADVVILETSKAALAHPYPGPKEVVVIADGLKTETCRALKLMGVVVMEVNFQKSTKGKALLYALENLPPQAYDVAVVLDADNIMGANCLTEINRAFAAGYRVVQTHRTAKNTNTAFALLDACNEEINNHIYRQGQFAVGLSAALIGSGMAFEYAYFSRLLTHIGETVGEDKEIDFRIARDQVKIAYLPTAYVYDEKIENAQVFTRQRTRWLASQLEFMKKYAGEGLTQLFRGNVEFFNKVIQAFLVPRMLLIGLLGLIFLVALMLPVGPPAGFWFALLLLLGTALLISLPRRLYNQRLWQALVRLPYALVCMVLAMFRVHKTKTSFLATPHKAHTLAPDIKP